MTTASNCAEIFSPWDLLKTGETFENVICTYINSKQHFLFKFENDEFDGDVAASQHVEEVTSRKITEEDSGLILGFHDFKLGWISQSCDCCKRKRPKIMVEAQPNLCQFINFFSNELLALSRTKVLSRNVRTRQFRWLTADECLTTQVKHASLEDIGLKPEKIRGMINTFI